MENNKNLLFGEIDITLNEIEDIKLTQMPTLLFYKYGETKPIKFGNQKTKENIIKFVRENAYFEITDIKIDL